MGDTTYSVRVPEEVKEKLTKISQETGLTGKEFMEDMLSLYQLHQTKEESPIAFQTEVNELRQYMNRVNSIYANILERARGSIELQEKKTQEAIQKKDTALTKVKDDLNNAKVLYEENLKDLQKACDARDKLEKEKSKLEKQYQAFEEQAKDTINSKDGLLTEYKSQIENLTESIKAYEGDREELENERKERQQAEKEKEGLQQEKDEKEERIHQLVAKMEQMEQEHAVALETLRERESFLCEKKMMEMEKEYREQLQEKQEVYTRNQEVYNDKIKELLEKLEFSGKVE